MTITHDVIDMYARLSLSADRHIAAGKRPPTDILQALNSIEVRARAVLSPQQFAAAQHHMYVAKNRIIQESSAHTREYQAQKTQQAIETGVRRLTRGMAGQTEGLSSQQFQAVLQGKPIPAQARLSQEQRDAAFRERTAGIDPHGRGWSEKEWADRLNNLADANPEELKRLSQEFRADPEMLRSAAKTWSSERVGYELQRRRAERDVPDVEIRANADDERRADVIAAFGEYAHEHQRPDIVVDMMEDPTPQHLLEEEGSRGDVARAWDAVEAKGETA